MLMHIAIVLLFAGWPINSDNQQIFAVQCDGYEVMYKSESRYDLVEEVELCSQD